MLPVMTSLKTRPALDALLIQRSQESNELYEHEFEQKFIERTLVFYAPRVTEWLTGPVGHYLRQLDGALRSEEDRARALVVDFTRYRLIEACRQNMIHLQGKDLVCDPASGMLPMLRSAYRTQLASESGGSIHDASEFGSMSDPKQVRSPFQPPFASWIHHDAAVVFH